MSIALLQKSLAQILCFYYLLYSHSYFSDISVSWLSAGILQPNLDRPNVPYILTRNANTLTRVMSLTQEPESSAKLPGAPDGSEPTLDINSATKGDRVVTVVEASTEFCTIGVENT